MPVLSVRQQVSESVATRLKQAACAIDLGDFPRNSVLLRDVPYRSVQRWKRKRPASLANLRRRS